MAAATAQHPGGNTTYPHPVNQFPPLLLPQHCVGYPVDLVIVRKVWTLTDDFVVTDVNKNVLFRAKGKILSLHDKRLLSDASDNPITTLRQKVYKGDSSEDRDLLFTAKTSFIAQFKTKLNVYLAHNTSQDVSDYWVKGSFTKGSTVIYIGDSQTNIAAQMQTKDSVQSVVLRKDEFMVTVSPNVVYAFVLGLILILDATINVTDAIMTVVTKI